MKLHTIPVGTIGTNCYIAASEAGGCAVIDPGAQGDKIVNHLEKENLTCKFILITHGHYDHIGGIKKIMEKYPEAVLHIGENDVAMLSDTQESLAVFRHRSDEDYIIGPSVAVCEGDEIVVDDLIFHVIDTPGHTKGGVCYLCDRVLFSGDTLFKDNVGRCDLPGGDYSVMLRSLKKLSDLEGDYTVLPGHGAETTLEHERKSNMYIHQAVSGK